MKRSLSLRTERLAELGAADLAAVLGAAATRVCVTNSLEVYCLISRNCYTANCPSIDACA